MTDDRGQAVVVAIFVLAIAAASIVGLRAAQDRLFAAARSQRAGEAAAEAAAASVADDYVRQSSSVRSRMSATPRPTLDVARVVADPRVLAAAGAAAREVASANSRERVDQLSILCSEGRVEVRLRVDGISNRAGFNAPECSRR